MEVGVYLFWRCILTVRVKSERKWILSTGRRTAKCAQLFHSCKASCKDLFTSVTSRKGSG